MLDRLLSRRRTLLVFVFLFLLYSLSQITPEFDQDGRLIVDVSSLPFTSSKKERTVEETYRSRLEHIRPVDKMGHSQTMGFADAIYVISLARRQDRKVTMEAIAEALNLTFTYIDATDFMTPGEGKEIVENLFHRVKWQRPRINERVANNREDQPDTDAVNDNTFVWRAFPFEWAEDTKVYESDPLKAPVGVLGADYWDMDPPDEEWERLHSMTISEAESRGEGVWEGEGRLMTASVTNNMYKNEPLTKAMVSCWHSHVKAMRDMIKHQHKAAIFLEDDVDMEWDIQRTLRMQWDSLPADWDIVYLGHCFSEEYRGEMLPHAPMLHATHHTLCTHGYALSLRGVTRIYRYLRSPDYAFGKPIDHGLKDLVQMHLIKSWSVYPPVVVQRKDDISDIVGGVDLAWKAHEGLVDSTLERVGLVKEQMKLEKEAEERRERLRVQKNGR